MLEALFLLPGCDGLSPQGPLILLTPTVDDAASDGDGA